jgi:hypothetical protein
MTQSAPTSNPGPETRLARLVRRVRKWIKHPAAGKIAAVVTVVAGLVGTVGNLERAPAVACRVPGIHSLCGMLEIGNVAGEDEEKAWREAQAATDPRPLRAYLVAYPTGVYTAEASTRLAACRSSQRAVWTAETRSLPLYVSAGAGTSATLAAARDAALQRGRKDAADLCAGFTGEFRLRGAAAQVREWLCRERQDGASCGFEGTALCNVEARRLISEETCR